MNNKEEFQLKRLGISGTKLHRHLKNLENSSQSLMNVCSVCQRLLISSPTGQKWV